MVDDDDDDEEEESYYRSQYYYDYNVLIYVLSCLLAYL